MISINTLRRVALLICIVALALVSIAWSAERATRALPFGLSCRLPTPHSCLSEMALQIEDDPEIRGALKDSSRKMAERYPADAQIQSFFAMLAQQTGDGELAGAYFRNAARLGWRDPGGQIYSIQEAAASGQAARAILHYDALLRVNPAFVSSDELTRFVISMPELRTELAKQLSQSPPYTSALIAALAKRQGDNWQNVLDTLEQVRLQSSKHESSGALGRYLLPHMGQLFGQEPQRAQELWEALAGSGEWANGSPVWDPGMRHWSLEGGRRPFLWHLTDNGRRMVRLVVDEKQNRAFTIDRKTRQPAMRLVSVAILLVPGRHQIEWIAAGPDGDKLYLQIEGCGRRGVATIDGAVELEGGRRRAELNLGGACETPMLHIAKKRGSVRPGSQIHGIKVDGFELVR